jgi:hypothetical protein
MAGHAHSPQALGLPHGSSPQTHSHIPCLPPSAPVIPVFPNDVLSLIHAQFALLHSNIAYTALQNQDYITPRDNAGTSFPELPQPAPEARLPNEE